MPKALISAVVAAGALSLWPAFAGGDTGPFDYAVGSGEKPAIGIFPERHIAFSAHETTQGIQGHYNSKSSDAPLVNFSGRVTCLFVVGNRAIVGGVVTHAEDPTQEGTGFATAFEDNGEPTGGTPTDRASLTDVFIEPGRLPPVTEADCAAEAGLFAFLEPISSGNFVIRDAPA